MITLFKFSLGRVFQFQTFNANIALSLIEKHPSFGNFQIKKSKGHRLIGEG
jgi:hypothetical protein